ncbi:hypothetical protein ACIRQQ_28780 [Streptomyces fuscichromogenes]|uniref:hypothetical protein n=1 Tax=Streptomyces fuscichromogenes TaxID=1324013 RepID=UPI003827AC05
MTTDSHAGLRPTYRPSADAPRPHSFAGTATAQAVAAPGGFADVGQPAVATAPGAACRAVA